MEIKMDDSIDVRRKAFRNRPGANGPRSDSGARWWMALVAAALSAIALMAAVAPALIGAERDWAKGVVDWSVASTPPARSTAEKPPA
jgi:hypothetical protein